MTGTGILPWRRVPWCSLPGRSLYPRGRARGDAAGKLRWHPAPHRRPFIWANRRMMVVWRLAIPSFSVPVIGASLLIGPIRWKAFRLAFIGRPVGCAAFYPEPTVCLLEVPRFFCACSHAMWCLRRHKSSWGPKDRLRARLLPHFRLAFATACSTCFFAAP